MREKNDDDHGAGLAAGVNDTTVAPADSAPHVETHASALAAFVAVLERAQCYEMPHLKLPIDAAEQLLGEIMQLVRRAEQAESIRDLAMDVLCDWHRGESPRGTEQCPDCARFPYEGHRNECRVIYVINRWRADRKRATATVPVSEASGSVPSAAQE